MIGNIADISIFSLHPRKSITTGEGGIVSTNNTKLFEWLKKYKNFGIENKGYSKFEIVGTNLKLSNINSIFGIVQFEIIDKIIKDRHQLVERYKKFLKNSKITFQKEETKTFHSYQTFCILVENRDEIIKKLKIKGIETQIGYYALSEHNAFKNNKNVIFDEDLKNSIYLSKHSLALPLYYKMSISEQDYVLEQLLKII